jgi:signal transduction histidine kinase/ABC-type branched-subunit amino acid transport system ATPase component
MTLALPRQRDQATAPLLRVEALTVRFDTLRALDQVDFAMHEGETVALAGENGAGKSTLIRCIGGDITPTSGRVYMDGERVGGTPAAASRRGVAVVWQDLALCDNLDVASNLLLGNEPPGVLRSESRVHQTAQEQLADLGIRLEDTTRGVGSLSGGERQLLAVARAMSARPRLLVLDEPTGALGVNESARVEQLTANVSARGTSVLLVSHDIDQMFRLADRIVVLRHGRVVAELKTSESHPDDVLAFISGQQTDSSARRQLSRLHGLADRLASADPSSSLALILSALGGALGTAQLCLHLLDGERLRTETDLGLPPALTEAWADLPIGADGGPVGLAAAREETVMEYDVRVSRTWAPWLPLAADAEIRSSWSVPVTGTDRLLGVMSVFRASPGYPPRHELRLADLYAGYVASAVERERLLGELTARNRVLETIRDVLETLAGPVPLARGLVAVMHALRAGLQAERIGLLSRHGEQEDWLVLDDQGRTATVTAAFADAALVAQSAPRREGKAQLLNGHGDGSRMAVSFLAPGGSGTLLAQWREQQPPSGATALLEDAANSLRLAREREESERARQEASALRRSRELQRGFLSRLSHELRTPLTAIGGYASSLMAPDVTWDGDSERRFLSRIGAESARLNRLVDDLLDFSAIESSTMRLQPDWCELAPVIDAAVACVTTARQNLVHVECQADLPVVWADHDRLEQVFVNLLENALRHNPEGTNVTVEVSGDADGGVLIRVSDDGVGLPAEVDGQLFEPRQGGYGPSAGAGLGLSIARGIVEAHQGQIVREHLERGTGFCVHLPIGGPDSSHRYAEDRDLSDV